MDFIKQFSDYTEKIEEYLDDVVPLADNYQSEIYEAMRYSLLSGGKRIRPVLCMAVCDMLGGSLIEPTVIGSAIECIHTYSLIHDDLPCMDNDDFRRGKPTNHKVFGETTALLAGDGLLNKAFEIIGNADVPDNKKILCLMNISTASGVDGMIGGQVIDLKNEKNADVSVEELKTMHSLKTGALIDTAAYCGAVLGGATETEITAIKEFSSALGLAFQVKDDILDYTGNEELLGKPVGSDAENEKVTFVTLFGIEKSEEILNELTEKAKSALDIFGEKAEFLLEFADFLLERSY